jgi:hypothetical protein
MAAARYPVSSHQGVQSWELEGDAKEWGQQGVCRSRIAGRNRYFAASLHFLIVESERIPDPDAEAHSDNTPDGDRILRT